jgi:pilus assembly protein Flp/PilA
MLEYMERLAARLRRDEGQTLVEYALIIALVSIVLVGALTAMAGALSDVFNFITTTLEAAI